MVAEWKNNKFYSEYDASTARMFTTIVNAPGKWLESKSNSKMVESSIISLRLECGTVSPYFGIYAYDDGTKNGAGNIVIYTMLTGLKAPMERLLKLKEDAVRENEEVKEKEQKNKIDFSALDMDDEDDSPSFAGLMLPDDEESKDEDDDDDEDMDITLELLRKQGLMK